MPPLDDDRLHAMNALNAAWDNVATLKPSVIDPPEKRHADRLELIWFENIQPPTASSALVKGVLDECGMSVLYGESGGGKTFFTLDLGVMAETG